MFERECPACNKLIQYKGKYNFERAIKNKTLCVSCSHIKMVETRNKTKLENKKVFEWWEATKIKEWDE